MPHTQYLLRLALLLAIVPTAKAVEQCHIQFPSNDISEIKDKQLRFESDNLDLKNGNYLFTGNVRVHQGKRIITANSIAYDSNNNTVNAKDQVRLLENNLNINSDTAAIDIGNRRAQLENVDYQLPSQHGHGKAEHIVIKSENSITLSHASYSTCDPGKENWKIRAAKMHFDSEKQSGSATHIVLWLGRVPVFYFPYIQFPIGDKRKSGFLAPRIKLSDTSSGAGFSLPYYINIAPNKDATITPRFLTERGLQVQNEFRYLNRYSNSVLLFDYLPDDKIYGQDRTFSNFSSSGGISKKAIYNIQYSRASDSDYFIDLGNSLYSSNVAHLEQKIDLQYKTGFWSLLMRSQKFQTLDATIAPAQRPYQRVPQVQISYKPENTLIIPSLEMELVNFKRPGSTASIRSHISPEIKLNLKRSYGYIRPAVRYYLTQYQNKELANEYSIERKLHSYHLDSGLFFERNAHFAGRAFLQTLEPKFGAIKTPYKNQDAIPIFDTSRLDENFNNIFQANRYSGIDRIGDTEHISLGLIHRWIDLQSGNEELRLELGHVFYLKDRLVVLPGEPALTDPESSWLSSASFRINKYSQFYGEYVWDPNNNTSIRSQAQLNFSSKRQRFSLAYRKESKNLEQVSLLANGKIATSWQYTGQLVYDLDQDEKLEWWGGLEYTSCCWAIRFAKRSFINGSGEKDQHLLLEFELQGMSKVGDKISELFNF